MGTIDSFTDPASSPLDPAHSQTRPTISESDFEAILCASRQPLNSTQPTSADGVAFTIRACAIHEAGHAVIDYIGGSGIKEVRIRPLPSTFEGHTDPRRNPNTMTATMEVCCWCAGAAAELADSAMTEKLGPPANGHLAGDLNQLKCAMSRLNDRTLWSEAFNSFDQGRKEHYFELVVNGLARLFIDSKLILDIQKLANLLQKQHINWKTQFRTLTGDAAEKCLADRGLTPFTGVVISDN